MNMIKALTIGAILCLTIASCGASDSRSDNAVTVKASEQKSTPAGLQENAEVLLTSGISLTATLYLPVSEHFPAPAVVLYPGSQASTNLPGIAEHLATQGIVALDLNKRGVGGSGGHWSDETIERQSDDVLAAIAFLMTRGEVDPARIGVAGHSQGGWVAQLAAAKSPDISFVVLLAGPTQTVRDQILTDERYHLTGWGVPLEEVDVRIAMFGEFMEAALTNPAVCGPQGGHYLCGLFRYDPADALSAIKVPVLALYGANDPMTPPDRNEAGLHEALAHLPEGALMTHVFDEANHIFVVSETGLRDEYPKLNRAYVDGFLDLLSTWILER